MSDFADKNKAGLVFTNDTDSGGTDRNSISILYFFCASLVEFFLRLQSDFSC